MHHDANDTSGAAEATSLARRHFDALQSAVHAGLNTDDLRKQQENEVRDRAATWSESELPRLLAIYATEMQTLSVQARANRRAEADQQAKSRHFHWPFVAAALLTVSVIAAIAIPSCSPRH